MSITRRGFLKRAATAIAVAVASKYMDLVPTAVAEEVPLEKVDHVHDIYDILVCERERMARSMAIGWESELMTGKDAPDDIYRDINREVYASHCMDPECPDQEWLRERRIESAKVTAEVMGQAFDGMQKYAI